MTAFAAPDFHPATITNNLLLDDHDKLSAVGKNITLEEKARLKALQSEILRRQEFILITPDQTFNHIHGALFDRVHPLDIQTRLGHSNQTKQTYAMAVKKEDGSYHPTAVVYTYWSESESVPGHIRSVLDEAPRDLADTARFIVPYSISSHMPKAGGLLLDALHAHVYGSNPSAKLITLSPLRNERTGLSQWIQQNFREAASGLDDQKKQILALHYLFSKADPVQQFHQGRGAQIEEIHTGNSDSQADQSAAHGVMTAYYYPASPERLTRNRIQFQDANLNPPASAHIQLIAGQIGITIGHQPNTLSL